MKKKAEAVSIIGGADGPTSIFLAGTLSGKKPFTQRVRQNIYRYRRRRAEKKIYAAPHTLQEVIAYAKRSCRAVELPKASRVYQEQYACAKEALILAHRPELLGSAARIARPEALNQETAAAFYRQLQARSEMAARIPDSEMPMEFHIYEIRIQGGRMQLELDYRWELFGLSYSGDKKAMKQLKKIARELSLYYGVSEEDIRNKTKRYSSLLTTLSSG